ncbi:MAG: hypothetical protein A3J80_07245 [Desulfobacula sp. RIFOXYB2_FULL_45_6]|nr:MAG: hypothetical protein A3J80_07245 [Desulfobacula sp. RIFOXYB2_FULL_45_6]
MYFFDSSQTITPFSFMAGIRTGLERALSHGFFLHLFHLLSRIYQRNSFEFLPFPLKNREKPFKKHLTKIFL